MLTHGDGLISHDEFRSGIDTAEESAAEEGAADG